MFIIKFLLVICFLFVAMVFAMGFSVVRSFMRAFRGPQGNSQQRTSNAQQRSYSRTDESPKAPKQEKVFADNEGEYVEYEDVKN